MNVPVDFRKTYCNPLPLPDYPGASPFSTRCRAAGEPKVLYHEGKWYMYPAHGECCYWTDDFVNWRCRKMFIEGEQSVKLGFRISPAVAIFKDMFYLVANGDVDHCPVYKSKSPFGPWREIGDVTTPDGKALLGRNCKDSSNSHVFSDPGIFFDEDGRVFLHWGSSPAEGIWIAEADPELPCRLLTDPSLVLKFDPAHEWERLGAFNEDEGEGWIEGSWLFKHGGKYYMVYSAAGVEYPTYALGVYVAASPLGPYRYQQRNPVAKHVFGFVHGTGHGSVVRGPRDTLWVFYTCLVRNEHKYERRLGMDPAGFDENGDLFTLAGSGTPQWAPGEKLHPENGNATGLLPVSAMKAATASSEFAGHYAGAAIDNYPRSWWQPADDDMAPTLTVDFCEEFSISAFRLCWKEPALDYSKGILPGPMRYVVETCVSENGEEWRPLVDESENSKDMLMDYKVFPTVKARRVRLRVVGWPKSVKVGVMDFSIFGVM